MKKDTDRCGLLAWPVLQRSPLEMSKGHMLEFLQQRAKKEDYRGGGERRSLGVNDQEAAR